MKQPKRRFRYLFCEIVGDNNRDWRKPLIKKFSVCFKCGDPEADSPDHHNPSSCGFTLSKQNAVLLCKLCNLIKADIDPRSFYTAEELVRLKREFGVETSNLYNRNFNVEIEFLYELIKDQTMDSIKKTMLKSGLVNQFTKLSRGQKEVISIPDHVVNIMDEKLINHLEKLITLDPENAYFNQQYDSYLEKMQARSMLLATEEENRILGPQRRREKRRNKRKNKLIIERRAYSREPRINPELVTTPLVESKEDSFDWSFLVEKLFVLNYKNGKNEGSNTSLIEESMAAIIEEKLNKLGQTMSFSFHFNYWDKEKQSKRVKLLVKKNGRRWFNVRIGANSSLEKMLNNFKRCLFAFTEKETRQNSAAGFSQKHELVS